MQVVHLDLGQNGMTRVGFSYLLKALEKNDTLVSLDVSNQDSFNINKLG